MSDYESVLSLVSSSSRPSSSEFRDIVWASEARVVGIARDSENRVELFLRGSELSPKSAAVRRAVEYRSWHREDGLPLEANRLAMPALGHYDQVAAFVCTELLRNGADASLAEAFARIEPLIELAIEQVRVSHEAILGLLGELIVLEGLVRRADESEVAAILNSWHGWRKSARDFALGGIGVEVKTTTRPSSSHLISGSHQIEKQSAEGSGLAERHLFLVSVGLDRAEESDQTVSIPSVVDRIVERAVSTSAEKALEVFLARLKEYGSATAGGYDHGSKEIDYAFAIPHNLTFIRTYDMDKGDISALRSADLAPFHHVEPSSVSFRLNLPPVASYNNPLVGLNQGSDLILSRWLS